MSQNKRPHDGKSEQVHSMKVARRVIDTGGGFLLEETSSQDSDAPKLVTKPGAILGASDFVCEECSRKFAESYLLKHYEALVCDGCRDRENRHKIITKTEAKKLYLLNDADFDVREPPLKFILKKNPRNERWGDMKLYLESQVAQRALEVWGSDDKLEEAMEQRAVNREKLKQRKFDKKMKQLRMAARSSLYTKKTGAHQHDYGAEQCVNEDEDLYKKTCKECGHEVEFEKM